MGLWDMLFGRRKRSKSSSGQVGPGMSGAGVAIGSGDDLARLLMSHQASCRKCGTSIEFQEGASLAMDAGIHAKVVMCKKCRSIYEVQISPRGMQLMADVTSRYKK